MDRPKKTQDELLKETEELARRARALLPVTEISPKVPDDEWKQLQTEKENVQDEVKKVHRELLTTRKPQSAAEAGQGAVSILQAKEKLIRGHIQAYKDSKPRVLPQSVSIQRCLLLADLEKGVAEMGETLAYVTSKRDDTKKEIERETKLLHEREQINEALEKRLKEITSKKPEHPTDDSLVQDIEKHQKKMNAELKYLVKKLDAFISKTFPPVTDEEVRSWERKRNLPRTYANVLPLQAVLEELMNKCLESPGNPYINTGSQHWPPHLQLLLRLGITQQDPNDDTRIKLTPFHL